MTRFLASVSTRQEARSMLLAGADVIDIKDPGLGALGAVALPTIAAIVEEISGRAETSATIGDIPMHSDTIRRAIENTINTGVDIIKVGVFASSISKNLLHDMQVYTLTGARIVLVFFADLNPVFDEMEIFPDSGIYGVMLDTSDKQKGSLRSLLDENSLYQFVTRAKSAGLFTGLAGSLSLGDINPLLKLEPDFLGFRGALCNSNQRTGHIDPESARNVRAMIPVFTSNTAGSSLFSTL